MADIPQPIITQTWLAVIRHILTGTAVFVGSIGLFGLTQAELEPLVQSLMALGNAAAVLITAISGVVAVVMPIIAAIQASKKARAKAVSADLKAEAGKPATEQPATIIVAEALGDRHDVKEIVLTDKALAVAVPSDKVVSK